MQTKKIIIVSLIANALSACGSPPKLSEPEGEWISFEPSVIQPSILNINPNILNPTNQLARNIHTVSQPVMALPVKQLDYSKLVFVSQNGKNQPLYQAVRNIVPVSWTVKLSPEVADQFKSSVSWAGNDQWPYVLDKMLKNVGLDADINDSTRAVVIVYRKSIVTSVTSTPATPVGTKVFAGKPLLPDAKTKGANLLHPPIVPVVTQAATQPVAVKPVPIVKTLPVAPVLKTWTIDKGPSLRKAFKEWVDKEKCPIGGAKWNFEWLTDTDYAVDYPLSFRAVDFESVTTQLFSLYRKAEAPLYVSGYRQQCLIRVSDRK